MSRWKPEGQYDRPWLILCEGESDRLFFQALIETRGIDPNRTRFHIEHPSVGDNEPGGRSGFGRRLRSLYETSETFRENIKAVLVTSDNDDDPQTSLAEVRSQLRLANFPTPDAERTIGRKNLYPDVIILMVPQGPGNLETLCIEAAHQKWGLQAELNALLAAAPASTWGISKQSKMRVQAMLAATCRRAPDTSFARHWTFAPEYRIPLDHACFDDVAEFLRNFGELLQPQA